MEKDIEAIKRRLKAEGKGRQNLILIEKGSKIGRLGGRPKGSQSFSNLLNKMLDAKVHKEIIHPLDGRKGNFTAREIMLLNLIQHALEGDIKATEKIMDRIEGKPVQKVETHDNNQEEWDKLMDEMESGE